MFLLGSILFGIIGTGELQPWAHSSKDDTYQLSENNLEETNNSNEVGSQINLIKNRSNSTSYDALSSTIALKSK